MRPLSDLNRLYKAISAVFDTERLAETTYEPSENNIMRPIHLFDPLHFRGTPYYLTCDNFGVVFYETNSYRECFDVVHMIRWENVKNFDTLLVEITMIITNNIYKKGETV